MPLDGSNDNPGPYLSSYTPEGLAWILLNGNDGRPWNYMDCTYCAIGTARARWGHMTVPTMTFGNEDAADRIFLTSGGQPENITPQIVAARIYDWIAGRPIRFLEAGDSDAGGPGPEFQRIAAMTCASDLVDA